MTLTPDNYLPTAEAVADVRETIGTCSICAGPVTTARSRRAPKPHTKCERCGAVPTTPHGPLIKMTMQPGPPSRD